VLLAIERAVATIRSSDPGEMPCHSVGTWHGPTAGEELLRSRTATEADAARRQTSAALRQGASAPSAEAGLAVLHAQPGSPVSVSMWSHRVPAAQNLLPDQRHHDGMNISSAVWAARRRHGRSGAGRTRARSAAP